ncbi:hypothetical protein Rhe02_60940 [Rhizocola hellebori]|uniref:Uncharacterized protein n=1 Tax=Rhizocola hellebori TaxID=1392758 RepID=A0A8J3QDG7_9ACTN|nr:hypothetical protein [Rhizocola hellebori]GIH08027.1 hypothetical protein Rhe02_60940 [Rhizocola hellebori]
MTRPGKAPRGRTLATLFAEDADAAILRVLEDAAGKALDAGKIKAALRSGGVEKVAADKAWKSIQAKRLKAHDQVAVDTGNRYRWTTAKAELTASEALDILAKGGGTAPRRARLVEIIRGALLQRAPAVEAAREPVAEGKISPSAGEQADLEWAARVRRAEGEGIRLLADLASTVEGLIDNETPPDAMLRMVRARVGRSALEAVGHAGEETTFDRKRHEPIGSAIRDGAPVFVVRPGYVWKKTDNDVLVLKVVVEE